jgi:hypothetical protein
VEREQRIRFLGFLFYLVLALHLVLTPQGISLLNQSLTDPPDSSATLTALLGLGVLLFSSEGCGYLLSSAIRFVWNVYGWPPEGGYSAEWRRNLSCSLKEEFIDRYAKKVRSLDTDESPPGMKDHLAAYTEDMYLSYFWQQAPSPLVQWVSRRHSAFFIGWSATLALGLGNLLGVAIIGLSELGMGTLNWTIIAVSLPLMAFSAINAQVAKKEAWQVIDLWQSRAADPALDGVLRELDSQLSCYKGREATPTAGAWLGAWRAVKAPTT